ncbi:hypothetical protein C0Q70_12689 [Pomacea canaliculata]|uniref:C-type lectin domain-containing protein n=2 Tax=Pomacea canaliculata TaxID=400727 RepID=A0A2T7P275_POMCA|nr:hypothetical protein C0Q70_12689 [Pomacea canaliculata]
MYPFALTAFAFLLLHECSGQFCPDDWTYFEGSCYLYVNEYSNWHDSKSICESLRSHLVEVTSDAENNFVANMVRLHKVNNIWAGMQDFAQDGHFVWLSSLQPPVYTHWIPGQPDDAFGGEDCLEILPTGLWNDRECDDYRSYPLCEQP